MKLLICDPIHQQAITYLKQNGIDITDRPNISTQELEQCIKNYHGLILRDRTKISADLLQMATNLKIIARAGTGVSNIDLIAAQKKGITVINAPGANSQAVAEFTVGLMLSLLRHIPHADATIKKGQWHKKELKGGELQGKTVGIIGFGNIGKKVAALIECFGATYLIHDKDHTDDNLAQLLSRSDIITLHTVLNDQTRKLINQQKIRLMKPTAYLINTSRAEIIDETALFEALKANRIGGAALDVFWVEPLPEASIWSTLDNVILTPHLGGQTNEASKHTAMIIAQNLVKFNRGLKPDFIV